MDQGEAVNPKVESWMREAVFEILSSRSEIAEGMLARHHAGGCEAEKELARLREVARSALDLVLSIENAGHVDDYGDEWSSGHNCAACGRIEAEASKLKELLKEPR